MADAKIKTQATQVPVAEFLASVASAERRADAETLIAMMRAATGEEPAMWGPSIIGFGKYRYRYDSGRTGEMPVTAFSPRKTELVLYVVSDCAAFQPQLARLGKHRIGKCCLYIKRLADVDTGIVKSLIEAGLAETADRRVRD
jgi:hypothetical protein